MFDKSRGKFKFKQFFFKEFWEFFLASFREIFLEPLKNVKDVQAHGMKSRFIFYMVFKF